MKNQVFLVSVTLKRKVVKRSRRAAAILKQVPVIVMRASIRKRASARKLLVSIVPNT